MKKDRPEAGDSFSATRRRTTVGGELIGGDDVEGHSMLARSPQARAIQARGPEEQAIAARSPLAREGDEDDVEGHSLIVDPMAARDLARARDRDVVRQVEHRRMEKEAARRPFQSKHS